VFRTNRCSADGGRALRFQLGTLGSPPLSFALGVKNTLAILISTGLVSLALAVAMVSRSSVRVVKCDLGFHLLTARVLRGHERIYAGNQFEGRARWFLQKLHFTNQVPSFISAGAVLRQSDSVRPPTPVAHRCVLAIRVRSGGTGQHTGLEAILQDKAGRSLPLHGGNLTAFSKDGKEYVVAWDLSEARTEGGTYQAKIKRGDTCVAELELNDLPPVTQQGLHTGPGF
jgi:hypothetical protein